MIYSYSYPQRRIIRTVCSIIAAVSVVLPLGSLTAQEYLSQQKSSDTDKSRRLSEAIEEQSDEVKRLSDELNELRALLDRDTPQPPVDLPREPVDPRPKENIQQEESNPGENIDQLPPTPEPRQNPEPPAPPTPPEAVLDIVLATQRNDRPGVDVR